MKEDFLHYIWQTQNFDKSNLQTTDGLSVEIFHQGNFTLLQGPDFFNAKLKIGTQVWAGNIEIHLKSSDWYAHQHQHDPQYQNVILHVVWDDDMPIFNHQNQRIPTLILSDKVNPQFTLFYQNFFNSKNLPCVPHLDTISSDKIRLYQHQYLLEKLDEKSQKFETYNAQNTNFWEHTFAIQLFRNFGSTINGEHFEQIIKQIPYTILLKLFSNLSDAKAVLYGLGNMFPNADESDQYTNELQQRFLYLSHKFNLDSISTISVAFFKLRPDNFPTIRISQFVNLMHQNPQLFFDILNIKDLKILRNKLKSNADAYWDDKYIFAKTSSRKISKKLSNAFIDLLLINTILPMQYAYFKYKNEDAIENVIDMYTQIAFEKNAVTDKFPKDYFSKKSAGDSQSLIHLYKNYCKSLRCLQCHIGRVIFNKK